MEKSGITFQSSVIFVKDIEVSKDFYTRLMGMKIATDLGLDVILEGGLTLWQVFPEQVIPQKLGWEAVMGRTGNRFELCYEAEDIEEISRRISESGAELLHPLHEEPWGQMTIRFFDPDHHIIEIGESLPALVKRHMAAGQTPEQVSQSTGFPLPDVLRTLKE
jgi:catechol 2,3-dioxygenase-like lactoylglutathione lyase family enzyme